MTIKDILVHVDNTQAGKQRVNDALKLAQAYDAHLTGLYTYQIVALPAHAEMAMPDYLYADLEKSSMERVAQAKQFFTNVTDAWKSKVTWAVREGDPVVSLVQQAACHDLVMVGARDPEAVPYNISGIPDRAAIESGRPILVLPNEGLKENLGKRILVAWNGKRESVRAVNDAMVFLTQADAVEITAINEKDNHEIPCFDIAQHLSRHEVNVEANSYRSKHKSVGPGILDSAKIFGADMIIMGAYGHSRLQEYILGGATKFMLENTPLPILLSH